MDIETAYEPMQYPSKQSDPPTTILFNDPTAKDVM